jgi:type IX secretion system PorP/SprF family membrane protein
MKFLKITVIFVSTFTLLSEINAQQSPQFSQYLQNSYLLNPAITGAEAYFEVSGAYRNQWTGFDGAPRTATLSINTPLHILKGQLQRKSGESFQGVGAFIYSDTAGAIDQTGFYGSYAYHLQLSSEWYLSLGTFVGGEQFSYDSSEAIVLQNQNDNLIQSFSGFNFDMAAGLYLYSDYFFAGISANHIFNNDVPFDQDTGILLTDGTVSRNYNFLLGSRIDISADAEIVPSLLVKTVQGAPIQVDVAAKFVYQGAFWAGLGYRYQDALVGLVGFTFAKNFLAAYSYDYSLTRFSNVQSGSHEIILSYRFPFANQKCACPQNSL